MKTYTALLILLIGAFSTGQLTAETAEESTITDSKTWSQSFEVNDNAQVNLNCRESDVNITTWNQNTVEVKVTLVVEAYEQEELDKLLKAFAPSISGSSTEVNIKNPSRVSETSSNNKTRIKIDNQVIKVKSYRYKINIKMPISNHLDANTRFSTVNLGAHTGRVNLVLYECKIEAPELLSVEAVMDLKFSDGSLGSAKSMKLQAYECELELNEARELQMDAKFSKIKFNLVRDSRVNAYESDIDLGRTRSVKLKHNFGNFRIAEANNVELSVYEMNFTAGNVQSVKIPSGRFSKIILAATKTIDIQAAYETDITVAETDSLKIDARFCKIDVAQINHLFMAKSYESDFRIAKVRSGFRKIELDGRFTNAEFRLEGNDKYQMQADMSFGNLVIPTADKSRIKITKSGTSLKASSYPENSSKSTLIRIKGYETDVVFERP